MVFKLGPEPEMVHTLTLDVSPAVLIPFYDEDSGTLFLSSKVRNSQLLILCIFLSEGRHYDSFPVFKPSLDAILIKVS